MFVYSKFAGCFCSDNSVETNLLAVLADFGCHPSIAHQNEWKKIRKNTQRLCWYENTWIFNKIMNEKDFFAVLQCNNKYKIGVWEYKFELKLIDNRLIQCLRIILLLFLFELMFMFVFVCLKSQSNLSFAKKLIASFCKVIKFILN